MEGESGLMNAAGDALRSVVGFIFRQRHEEVVACETVVVIGRGAAHRSYKSSLLALCRPFAPAHLSLSSTSQATINVLRVNSARSIKVKLVLAVARLVDVSHDGGFDATFNFGGSGMISVSFESHIQREMFVAAVRKEQRDLQSLVAIAPCDVHAFLTDALDAEVEADAAARVKGLRRKKRCVLTAEDERRLQQFLGRHSFDDISGTERLLSTRQKEAELSLVEALVGSAEKWEAVRCSIADLVTEVVELEERIAQYSRQILAKKDQLQRIEHQNNTLQRKQHNLQRLYAHLEEFCNQLSLPLRTTSLLMRLRNTPDDGLVAFFSEGNNAQLLSDAMKHMRGLLHNATLSKEYPIAAVVERRAFFTEQRRMIANCVKTYIFSIFTMYEKQYLADRTRYSDDGRLVWLVHSELMEKLKDVSDVIRALVHIDLEGFIAVLRRYRVSMQRVYALEIQKFFKCLRFKLKKVDSHGPFLLGTHGFSKETLAGFLESTGGLQTPRQSTFGGGGAVGGDPSGVSTTSAGVVRSVCDGRESGVGGEEEKGLRLDVTSSRDESLRLFEATGLRIFTAEPVETISDVSAGYALLAGTEGGKLRPDLAFAVALETTFSVVLQEEDALRQWFGLGERTAEASDDNAAEPSLFHDGGFLAGGEQDAAGLLSESLFELFGGDRLTSPLSVAKNALAKVINGVLDSDSAAAGLLESEISFENNSGSDSGAIQAQQQQQQQQQQRCFLWQQFVGFARYCWEKCDRLYAVPVMVMLKAYTREGAATATSKFSQGLLRELEHVVASTISRSVAEQTASIALCRKRYIVRPVGVLNCFAKLPVFVQFMETVHGEMSKAIRNYSEYASIITSFVDQSFEVLNYVTNLTGTETHKELQLNILETIAKCANKLLDGSDKSKIKRAIIQQYRHHAFFCVFYASLPQSCYAASLLRERYESSLKLRDRYEEIYLTRIIFVRNLPEFGTFAFVAEDLARVHSPEELRHHKALSVDAINRVLRGLPQEVRSGIPTISRRMKKHFLCDVLGVQLAESFCYTLLQRLWQQFCKLLHQKLEFLAALLKWPIYKGIEMTITLAEVKELLEAT